MRQLEVRRKEENIAYSISETKGRKYSLTNIRVGENTLVQVVLPVRLGGLGIKRLRVLFSQPLSLLSTQYGILLMAVMGYCA